MGKINKFLETDVLVIGGGLAGCWAAIAARESGQRVALIDKAVVARSGASTFTNSMLAPPPADDLDAWHRELVEAGEYLNDQDWVRILLEEQPLRVQQMLEWGVPFERNADGSLKQTPGRGHKRTGLIMCNGHRMMEVMKRKVLDSGVVLLPRIMALDLLTSDGRHPTEGKVIGAAGIQTREGDFFVCRAGAVVLTTGVMDAKLKILYIHNLTGDGPAMAYRAGAELMGMEFCTIPKIARYEGKYYGGGSSLLQGFGARFINARGEEFIKKYNPELKNRSRVSYLAQCFAKEHYEGRGPVYLDTRSFTEEQVEMVKKLLTSQMKPLLKAGIDIKSRALAIDPVVSMGSPAGQGGVRVDCECRSSLPGLFAAGAASRNMVHGTYTVGGVNLAYCNVSGRRAGKSAALYAARSGQPSLDEGQVDALRENFYAPLKRESGISPDEALNRLHGIIIPAPVSMFKREKRLRRALLNLKELSLEIKGLKARDIHDLVKAKEIENLVQMAELVITSGIERRESRDTHYREDYPYRDDLEWLKWIVLHRDKNDGIVLRREPVPFERYPLKPPQRQRIPHPVQHSLGEEFHDY